MAAAAGAAYHFSAGRGYDQDDDDRPQQNAAGTFKVPDKDFYRKNFSTFGSVCTFLQDRLLNHSNRLKDRRFVQPHYSSLARVMTPYGNISNPADGICAHFLRRGFTKPNKILFNCATWSADARWLVLGTATGDLALWEGEALKVYKVLPIPAHKEFYDDNSGRIKEGIPITAVALKRFGNDLVTGDQRGLIQYCDETFKYILIIENAHSSAVRGLDFSPLDSKLVSCSDDSKIHIWPVGGRKPELTLLGHQNDVKCVQWHPDRSLLVSGSRDTSLRLWDPRSGNVVSTIHGHKKQVNCCAWNANGNWLASGSIDATVKIYDIRVMREMEVLRGHHSEVCSLSWHPQHESLLLSGGYNGSLIYWIVNQGQAPHTVIGDAHRQSVDVIRWHPAGHLVATASHDSIVKFWCREPSGSLLDAGGSEVSQENPTLFGYGPLPIGSSSIIPPRHTTSSSTEVGFGLASGSGPGARQTGLGLGLGPPRLPTQGFSKKRGREP